MRRVKVIKKKKNMTRFEKTLR